MRVLGDLAKIAKLGYSGSFGAAVFAKIFSSLGAISAYKLEDNAICLRVLLGFLS